MCWKLCLAKKSFRIFIVLKYANKHDSFVCCGRVIFCKVKEASLFSISMKYSGFMIFFDWLELCTVHYEPANFALAKLELIVF